MSEQLDALLDAEEANSSPIIESLQRAVRQLFADADPKVPRTLVIVSDMVQHSDAFSFFRRETWESFRASPQYERMGHTLSGVSLYIERIPRPVRRRDGTVVEKEEIWDFWVNYLDVQGAAPIERHTIGDL